MTQVLRPSLRIVGLLLLVLAGVLTGTAHADMITYFHNDPSGSPVAATDENGRLLWKESYRPYGERLLNEASPNANRLWFTGKPQDPDTGLSYLGARYYSPQLGRFMGIDPKAVDPGDPHSFNRYAYANNNPYKFVDPDGRDPRSAFYPVIVPGDIDKTIELTGESQQGAAIGGLIGIAILVSPALVESGIASKIVSKEILEEVANRVPRVTEEGVQRIEQHLGRPELNALDEPPNAAMLERLRSGNTTSQDINFYMHELKESAIMNKGVGARDAHLQTLEWQGIRYEPGYESQLYHPDVIRQFSEYFNPAAHP
jgi:RHS repeat-associated protein